MLGEIWELSKKTYLEYMDNGWDRNPLKTPTIASELG